MFKKDRTLAGVWVRVLAILLLGLFATERGISAAQTIEWANNEHGKFVMDLAENGGLAFVATEDKGVSVLYLATGKVERLQHPQMPEGDGAYAVLPSETGTWIGYGKSGVGLLSGSSFKLYTWPERPVGKRIFDIKERKSDGSIWICSEIGLTIVPAESVADSSKWILLSRAEGVNGPPLTDVHFFSDGTACVISQTNDITLIDNQGRVRPMGAPPLNPGDQLSQCQGAPTCAMIDTSDILWLGCTWGAVFTTDRGKTWRSLLKQQGYQPQDAFTILPNSDPASFEKDPYCASLVELSPGWYCYGLRSGNPFYFSSKPKNAIIPNIAASGFVKTQLAVNDDTLILGCYGEGLMLIQAGMPRQGGNAAKIKQGNASATARLPESKPLPDSNVDFERILVRGKADQSIMAPLMDDWATQGEWLGRYGTDWACLCAFCSPDDYVWGARSLSVRYNVWPSKNFSKDDTTRAWVHSLATRDRRALEMPRPYYQSRVEGGYSGKESDRRQSEWDDHGEAYALTHDGPHMMVKLSIPEGFFKLSLYNNNKDGHDGSNRFRDYMCYFRRDVDAKSNNTALAGYSGDILSVMRFNDFWSGCYKNAVIKGPVTVWLETNKNRSFNTILAAIMLTNLDYASTLNWFGIKFPALDRLGASSDPGIVRIVRLRGFIEQAKRDGKVTVYATYGARLYGAIYLETQRALKAEANAALRTELLAVLAESSYHIGEWKENELALKELALGSPRAFEMSLKWDGKRNMNGMESMLMPLPAD